MKKLTDIRHPVDQLVCLAVLLTLLAAPAAWAKPLYPFAAAWSQALDGERVRLVLTVSASIPLPAVAVAVSASEGLNPEGDTEWAGPMAAGEARELVLWLPRSAVGRVSAVVTVTTASNMQLSAGTAIDVPQPEFKSPPPGRPAAPAGGPAPQVRETVAD